MDPDETVVESSCVRPPVNLENKMSASSHTTKTIEKKPSPRQKKGPEKMDTVENLKTTNPAQSKLAKAGRNLTKEEHCRISYSECNKHGHMGTRRPYLGVRRVNGMVTSCGVSGREQIDFQIRRNASIASPSELVLSNPIHMMTRNL